MADKDTSVENEVDTSVDEVETPEDQEEDDSDNQAKDQDSQDEDESEEDSDEDSEEDDEEESDFQKAFSNIKGESALEYIPNLEEAYRKSSEEGKKLSTQLRDAQARIDQFNIIVSQNPELAKLVEDATEGGIPPTVDPALAMARQEYQEKIEKDLSEFLEEHEDLEDDEDLMKDFMDNLDIVGAAARKKGKILRPMEGYRRAWAMLGREEDSKDKVVNAAKNAASKSKPKASKKVGSKSDSKLTVEQLNYGKKMGLTEKQMLEALK